MNTKLTILLILAFASVGLHAADPDASGRLELKISHIGSDKGDVRIALFDSEKTYTKTPVHAAVVEIENRTAVWTVEGLKPGHYAIALFHDANGDGKMNKNIIGLPKEDYGFSNNASGTFGPPSWSKAKFTIGKGVTQHTIKLND